MGVPEWMRERRRPELTGHPSRRAPPNLFRRALAGFARMLAELMDNEAIAAAPGLLQRLDERAKVIGLLGLVVVVTLVHHPATLALAGLIALALAALSRLPARRLVAAWSVVPLFSAALVVPALLNLVTPGRPLVVLARFPSGHLGPWPMPPVLTITDEGLLVAARFVLRSTVCVTLVLLLSATTRADRLFRGLRTLGVPMVFVMLLSMMERYLAVFLRVAEELHLARLSRTVRAGSLRQEQGWVAAGMTALFRRTQELSQDVYLAMLSRGYRGEAHALAEPRWRAAEVGFLLAVAVAAALLVGMG